MEFNRMRSIIDVIPFVLATNPGVANRAAMSVHKLVLGTTTNELVWLDQVLRQRSSYSGDYYYEWHKLSPDQLGKLERLFRSSPHAHVRWNALSLIERLGKWDSIYYLLRAVRDFDEAIAERSRFAIQRWLSRFNRDFSSPTPEQWARLDIALEEDGNLLDDGTVEQLRFSLAGFKYAKN
jgi:hypothetical protein